jgi:hypothetical protein
MKKKILTQEQFNRLLNEEIEKAYLAETQLNEGFFMDLLGRVGEGMLSQAKGWIASLIMERMNIPAESLVGRVIMSAAERLTMAEIAQIISGDGGRCNVIATEVIEALQAAIIRDLPRILGLGADHMITNLVGNMTRNFIVDNSPFTQPLVNAICSQDFSSLAGPVRNLAAGGAEGSTPAATEIAAGAGSAATPDASINERRNFARRQMKKRQSIKKIY